MEHQTKQNNLNNLLIPASIMIAGLIIGGSLYIGLATRAAPSSAAGPQPQQAAAGDLEQMASITARDHVRGNPDASVKIVEYSDTECPYCKRFHETMKQATAEYGDKVAWVYRHFPLDQLHSKARTEAVAAECANELGGNDAFWKYIDRFFELTPSNDQTNIDTVLPQIAREIGLNKAKFASCLGSKKYDAHVEENVQNAKATGGNGTPWSIVVTKSGKKYPLSGAQPYEALKQLIDLALKDT